MAEIFTFGSSVVPGEPVEEVVRQLRETLEQAEAGNIRAVAMAAVYDDRCVSTQWAQPEDGSEKNALAGAVARMQHEYLVAISG